MVPNFRWIQGDVRTMWNIHPYGLCMIAASLKDSYDVSLIDANFYNLDIDSFTKRVEEYNPHIVGISVLTSEYAGAGHFAAKLIKEIDQNITVILGGVYPTTQWADIDDRNIDYIFVGEGELAFKEFVDMMNKKRTSFSSATIFENKHNMSIIKADIINNLDDLPFPAYDIVNYADYTNTSPRESVDEPREYPYGRIMTSRGCPINCVFCQVHLIMGNRFRKRSPENIAQEIEFLKDKYGIRYLIFDDDNLFLDKKRAIDIFNIMIERQYNLKWHPIATAVYALDEEVLNIARESGLQYVDLAIESGVERVLKDIINKPVNLQHAKKVVRICRDLGINTAVNFVIGFPGETWDEIRRTLVFAEEIDADYCKIFIANPLPGTRLYDLANETGSLIHDRMENSWFLGRIQTKEFSSEDLAILRAYEWDRINFKTPEKKEKIAKMMRISTQRLDEIRRETLKKTKEILLSSTQRNNGK